MLILLMSSGGVLGVNFLLPILLQRGLGHTSMIAALILLPEPWSARFPRR